MWGERRCDTIKTHMKIISLNTWHGTQARELKEFLERHNDTDVFLFQEVFERGWPELGSNLHGPGIATILSGHTGYFYPAQSTGFGVSIFIKKEIEVVGSGSQFMYRHFDSMVDRDWTTEGKLVGYVTAQINSTNYNFFTYHGLWRKDKKDCPERIEQSHNIVNFIKNFSGKTILGGDFNLRPDTQSVKIIERDLGLENLITKYNITSTRTPLYTRSDEKYADFMFVSPELLIKDFKVIPDLASDHAALSLEM